MMTDAYHKLPLIFDIECLKQDLEIFRDICWINHVNTEIHNGGWGALPLRSVDGRIDNAGAVEMNAKCYHNTPYLDRCGYLQLVLSSFQCQLLSARLMRLKAGDKIGLHTDVQLCFEDGCVRLHIPIQTHSDVTFLINDHPIHFAEGECWYMNANYPHQVNNNSGIDRIHLVVDCIVNDWLKTLFIDSGYRETIIDYKYGEPGIVDANVYQIIAELERLGSEFDIARADKLRACALRK